MKIIVTARMILERGCWDEFCDEFGINPWALNEGLMESSEEFTLTEEQARKYGFLKSRDGFYET